MAMAVHKLWHLSWPRCSDEAGASCALVELALWPCDLENPTAGHILQRCASHGHVTAMNSSYIDSANHFAKQKLIALAHIIQAHIKHARLVASAPSLALDPTFGIHSHKTLDTAQPCHLLKPN